MFLKNMADWGLHSGVYFFTIFVSYLAKKILSLKSIISKGPLVIKLSSTKKIIEW